MSPAPIPDRRADRPGRRRREAAAIRWLATLCAGVVLAAAVPGAARPVAAAATFARSDPPAGTMVASAPFVLSVWFSEELTSRSALRVLDRQGTRVDLGD